jgi:hypothetical protein
MSYYDVHDAQVNYLICTNCQTEAFAWMAKVFACPKCGGSDFVFPEHVGESDEPNAADEKEDSRSGSNEPPESDTKVIGKRKRTVSDEGKSGK